MPYARNADMLCYEKNLETAVMCMCEEKPCFSLSFAVFIDEIRLDYDNGKIIAPITEKEGLLDYFKRNGFLIRQFSNINYRVSAAY